MSKRRRILMGEAVFEPDPEIPAAWKAAETIQDSWSEIIYHCKKGDYKNRYKLGATKVANFGDEGLTLMRIVGFDCDELTDGSGYAHISWCPEHCLKTVWKWNNSNSNSGGYASSKLKARIDSLLTKLPKSLQDGIVEVKKSCRLYKNSDQSVNVKLWAPSYREYYGSNSSYEQSGPIYTNPPKPAKMTGSSPDGSAAGSWLRSAGYTGSSGALCVGTYGSANYSYSSNAFGVLPGFCI